MLEALASILRGLTYAIALSGSGMVLAGQTLGLRSSAWVRGLGLLLVFVTGLAAILFLLRLGAIAVSGETLAILASPLGLAMALHASGGLMLAIGGWRIVQLCGAAAILLAFGIVGHAATEGLPGSIAIVLHVTAAAWWLGGLWLLLRLSSSSDFGHFVSIVQRFGMQAIWVVSALLAGAMVSAGMVLELSPDLGRTYDRGLIAKVILTISLLALAAANRLLLTPQLATSQRHRQWIKRSILAELLVFGTVLGITAWLTTTQSPHASGVEEQWQIEPPQGSAKMRVSNAWAPALPGASGTGSAYMTLANLQEQDDRLIAASSPWSEAVTLHRTTTDGQMTGMADMDALMIPAGAAVTLEPSVYHLMFTGLYAPFLAGDDVPMTLEFEKAGTIQIVLGVRALDEIEEIDHAH